MPNDKVLILDGRALSCLSLTRSLGNDGTEVHVGECFRSNISAFSKFTSKRHVYPSPDENFEGFEKYILKLVEKEEYDFIIPIRDTTTILLAKIQERLPRSTKTLLGPPEAVTELNNKEKSAKLAERAGVPIPATYYPSESKLDEIQQTADFPLLVKPKESSGARGILRVNDPSQLKSAYQSVKNEKGEAIIQEFVDHSGGHFSVGTVFDRDSQPRAIHVYKELIQYPDSGGPAIQAVSVEIEPWVDEMLDILKEVDWIGPAHMDILFDPADNTYKLLEVNPRIWMSVNLTIKSGINIPRIMIDIANNNSFTTQSYQAGLRYRWVLPNELLWVMSGENKLSRIKQLSANRGSPVCYGVLSRHDPHATVGMFAQSLNFILDKEKRKIIFNRGW